MSNVRPSGQFPPWAGNSVVTPEVVFTPGDKDAGKANYPFANYRNWLLGSDCLEVINYGSRIDMSAPKPHSTGNQQWGLSGDLWRRHSTFVSDPGFYLIGAMNQGANKNAGLLTTLGDGSDYTNTLHGLDFFGNATLGGVLVENLGDSPVKAFYQAAGNPAGPNLIMWLTEKTPDSVTYYRSLGGGDLVTDNDAPAGYSVQAAQWDAEQARFVTAGYTSGGPFVAFTAADGIWTTWTRTDALTDQLKFVAVGPGNKLAVSSDHLWYGQNILSTWRVLSLDDICVGRVGPLLGLTYGDNMFWAVFVNGIWTSGNGVVWARTPAPQTSRTAAFTGPIAIIGGAAIAAVNIDGITMLAVGRNYGRQWFLITSPTVGVGEITNVNGRVAVINNSNFASLRYSLLGLQ